MILRVLCLWNTAGVYVPIAKWLRKNGYPVRILARSDYDTYGHTSSSRDARMSTTAEEFFLGVIDEFLRFRPDIIHVNSAWRLLPLVRILSLTIPVVFQFHGSEIRRRMVVGLGPPEETALADRFIVSTEDLQRFGEWYDRPIPEEFQYKGGRRPSTALMVYVNYVIIDQRRFARELCSRMSLDLTILDRTAGEVIPYSQMPEYLSKFEYYLDFKGHIEKTLLSKTALEALACGCKVIQDAHPELVITDPAPYVKNNHPRDYFNLYRQVLGTRRRRLRHLMRLLRYVATRRKGLYYVQMILKYAALRIASELS